ncbi:MAG TPA: hypothetical protein VMR52_05545 [Dehalococcoidia bacterium]|nr:hypothetical protein [Dehalococcoidia bacterium]
MKKLLATACLFVVTTVAIVFFIAPLVSAQETKQSEREAMYRRYLEFASYVKGGSITPHWMADGSSFWYAEGAPTNTVIWKVDSKANTKTPLFETARLREALSRLLGHQPPRQGLPFAEFTFVDDGEKTIKFSVENKDFILRLDSYKITLATVLSEEEKNRWMARPVRERTHRLLLRSVGLAVATWTILPVSAQRSEQREILFDSRMGPTPASPGLGPAKGQEIWLIRSDGSGLRRLTESPSEDTRNQTPRWSPDGRLIAFSSTRHAPSPENTDADIYVMNRDGSRLQRLTYGLRNGLRESHSPEWSPNGRRIAFTSNGKIYVMGADGSNLERLMTDQTFSSQVEGTPAWSPDGKRIAFAAIARDRQDYEIYILNLETSTLTQLTDNNIYDAHVAWSPDGQYLSFDSDRDGNSEIYVMRPDGSQVVRLTNHPRMDNAARWSRDGQRLAFNSTRDFKSDAPLSNFEIYVMNRDGSGLRRLTNNSVKDTHPDW